MLYRLAHINPDTNRSDYPISRLEIEADTPQIACRLAIVAMTGLPLTRIEHGVVNYTMHIDTIQIILDNLWVEDAEPKILRTPTAAEVVA